MPVTPQSMKRLDGKKPLQPHPRRKNPRHYEGCVAGLPAKVFRHAKNFKRLLYTRRNLFAPTVVREIAERALLTPERVPVN